MITLSDHQYQSLCAAAEKAEQLAIQLAETEALLRDVADHGRALIWMSSVDKKCCYFNQPWLDFTGRTLQQESGDGWMQSIHPDDVHECVQNYCRCFDRHQQFALIYRLRRADGQYRWMLDHGTPRFRNGEFSGYIGHCLDISEHKRDEILEHTRSEALSQLATGLPLNAVLETIVLGIEKAKISSLCSILLFDAKTRQLHNGAAPSLPDFYNAAIEGLTADIGVGCCGTAVCTGEVVIAENIIEHPYWQNYLDLASQAGLAACWSAPIFSSQGEILGSFAIYHAMPHSPGSEDFAIIAQAAELAGIAIERARDTERLHQLATTDYLTGLANRRVFYQQLETELLRIQRSNQPAGLLMLDLDNFKTINDVHGHSSGDQALKLFAALLDARKRETDLAARIGGEEFALLLPATDLQASLTFAEELRRIVEQNTITAINDRPLQLTVSIGVAELSASTQSAELVMKYADQALYMAKASGRNRIHAWSEQLG